MRRGVVYRCLSANCFVVICILAHLAWLLHTGYTCATLPMVQCAIIAYSIPRYCVSGLKDMHLLVMYAHYQKCACDIVTSVMYWLCCEMVAFGGMVALYMYSKVLCALLGGLYFVEMHIWYKRRVAVCMSVACNRHVRNAIRNAVVCNYTDYEDHTTP